MNDRISVLIPEEEINAKLDELAARLNEDYKGKHLHVIGILKGSVYFVCELTKRLTMPVILDFMTVSSYGDGMTTSGYITVKKDTDIPIEGKHVLIVEDIIDSGVTMSRLLPLLKERNPKSIRLASLLSKPSRRIAEVDIDYLGYTIEDKFVVGFGLDYAQEYRNLPYIGIYKEEAK